jgi:hypothetical protein
LNDSCYVFTLIIDTKHGIYENDYKYVINNPRNNVICKHFKYLPSSNINDLQWKRTPIDSVSRHIKLLQIDTVLMLSKRILLSNVKLIKFRNGEFYPPTINYDGMSATIILDLESGNKRSINILEASENNVEYSKLINYLESIINGP